MKSEHASFKMVVRLVVGLTIVFCAAAASVAAQPVSSFSNLVKKVGPGVVNIVVVKKVQAADPEQTPFGPDDPFKDFFEHYFGNRMPKDYSQGTLGTGFIIDADGLILTNNHVVEDASDLKVKLADDREFPADVVGRDPKTDVALIRIKTDDALTPLRLGDSDKLEVGDWVVAIGNPFGLGNTVTSGIVSAKYRQIGAGAYDNFIQTDTPINPGNSGGPLINMDGDVIGINSAIFSQSGGSVGIGFAIPINMVKDLLPQLRQGKVRRAYLGVMVQDVTPDLRRKLGLETDRGALVSDVPTDSPAAAAGIQRGDVILSVDGKSVKNSRELPLIIATKPIGKSIEINVLRRGKTIALTAVTRELEEEIPSADPEEAAGARLGLSMQTMTAEVANTYGLNRVTGVLVLQVEAGSPGADAGLEPGDVIIEVEQQPVNDVAAFQRIVGQSVKDKILLILVDRGGSTFFLTLTLP
ncbi:putative periplasmic serine endoprotease DegP-like [Desulfosarcina cetonica]|nr:putative periplasmic serine endoprotease DegP-like [Desulfosarcina cetonica]